MLYGKHALNSKNPKISLNIKKYIILTKNQQYLYTDAVIFYIGILTFANLVRTSASLRIVGALSSIYMVFES